MNHIIGACAVTCIASYDGDKEWYERCRVAGVQLVISQVSFVP